MAERILFLTGHLARARLEKTLAGLGRADFDWAIVDIGVKVAALMTEAIIRRRLSRPVGADRVVLPGRCRADLGRLAAEFGVPFERGPDELKDLPAYFGKGGRGLDLSRYDIRIFAEIVDASALTVETILARAVRMREAGADVIDLGCQPDTPFRHLEDVVRELTGAGLRVSVDSGDPDELRRGAGARQPSISRAIPARHRFWFPRATGTCRRCCARPKRPSDAGSPRSSTRFSIRSTSASWRRCRATPRCGGDCPRPKS
jgi:hypothetical protein